MLKVKRAPVRAEKIACVLLASTAFTTWAAAVQAQTVTAPAASPTASSPFSQPPSTPLPTANPPEQSSPTANSPAAQDPSAQPADGKASVETTRTNAAGNSVSEVVVTGQRAALRSAIDVKKNADIILDSISADEAGKLPDNSVTEVLQRIAGVNISRIQTGSVGSENFLAEGTGVQIRGLTSVTSLLNGRDTFSSVNGNVLAFEDVPPELLQGVDVYKTLEGNLPEGGLGGTVNLRTREPFDYKGLTASGTIEANYADFAHVTHPDGNLLVSDRWDTNIGQVGLLVDYAYSDLATRADGVQVQPYLAQAYDPSATVASLYVPYGGTRLPYLGDPGAKQVFVPDGVDFSEREDDRQRQGIYAAAQWRPNDKFIMGLTFFDSAYRMNSYQHLLMLDDASNTVIPAGATATFAPNGFLTSTSNLQGYAYVPPNSPVGAQGGGNGGQSGGSGYSYTNNPYDFQSTLQQTFNYTQDVSLTGDWAPTSNFDLKFAYQHVESGADETDKYAYDYAFLPQVGLTLSPYGSAALPKISIPATTNLADASNYGYLATMDHLTHNRGKEDAVYADGSYKFSDTGLIRYINFGVRLTSRYEDDEQTPYNYQALSPYYGSGPYGLLSGTATGVYPQYNSLVSTGNWFGGGLGLPAQSYFPSLTELQTNFGTLHQQLGSGLNATQSSVQFQSGDTSKINDNQEAVYVMALFRNDNNFLWPFRGNVGLRIIDDTDTASGNLIYPTSLGTYFTPTTYPAALNYGVSSVNFSNPQTAYPNRGGHSEVDVLPSFNIQFLPTPQTHLRFAASEGVGRPSFNQISPQGTVGGSYVGTYTQNFITSIVGDPNLKPQKALQLDASFEYYFRDGGLASMAVFYKRFDNFIGTRSVPATFTIPTTVASGGFVSTAANPTYPNASINPCGQPIVAGEYCPQTISATQQEYFNESVAASLEGVELNIQKYASFLPAPFNGFGVDANYTFINSSQPGAQAYDTLGKPISNLPVTGISRDTINAQLLYDQGPLSARLAYNWRDDFLVTTSAYQTSGSYANLSNVPNTTDNVSRNQYVIPTYYALPVWQYPSGQLDGNITYRFDPHLTGVLEASNLTKTVTRLYMGDGDQKANRSWYTADRRYRVALRFSY